MKKKKLASFPFIEATEDQEVATFGYYSHAEILSI